ncbi:septum formation family protein [Microbacterium sp. STN6]|uniref:septum formation family protein n=1 Tax=Microbacterium sp. STN6 TaxID=2995588 RepID=UPI002260AD74|nr:septum formation family protein [Microbacterium sp. STN6]MCX7522933.1 septum formation family protein [Microbacterium sp. STN6]
MADERDKQADAARRAARARADEPTQPTEQVPPGAADDDATQLIERPGEPASSADDDATQLIERPVAPTLQTPPAGFTAFDLLPLNSGAVLPGEPVGAPVPRTSDSAEAVFSDLFGPSVNVVETGEGGDGPSSDAAGSDEPGSDAAGDGAPTVVARAEPTADSRRARREALAADAASAPQLSARNTRALIIVAVALVVVLALIGLFVLGTRLPAMLASAPAPSASHSTAPARSAPPSPEPTPTVRPKPAAAQPAGVHAWNTLGGGECLQPYTSPWAEEFTVVDCATPHAGQLVYTALLSDDPAAAYPGDDALGKSVTDLCAKKGVIDLGAAAAYTDMQIQGSYPATAEQWAAGERSYYCFASRSSVEPMTASVAGGGPAA